MWWREHSEDFTVPARPFLSGVIQPGHTTNERVAAVLIWNSGKVSAEQRGSAHQIEQFVHQGARLVITAQDKWDWPEWVDFGVGKARGSHTFWSDGFTPPGTLNGAYLRRWNGHAGLIADGFIQGSLARSGRTLLWMEKPETPVLVEASQWGGRVCS